MVKAIYVLLVGTSMLRVCGRGSPPPTQSAAVMPEHGGAIATSGGLTAEVVAQPDGRMVTYVRDPQQQPLNAHRVSLVVRRPQGPVSVATAYDPAQRAYVGRPVGVNPGSYPVAVSVQASADAAPVEIVTPPVAVQATVRAPAPQHGGRVDVVGDYAVETVAARSGHVAMFWMDLDGRPIPASQVNLPHVDVRVGGRVHRAPVRVVQGAHIARVSATPGAGAAVIVPSVTVRGVAYHAVAVPDVVVVAALPSVYIVAPVAPAVIVAPARGKFRGGKFRGGKHRGFIMFRH